MARRYTFYRKKRGARVSGSAQLGTAGETLLFAACLLVGAVTLATILFWVALPQWRIKRNFVEGRCTVVATPGTVARPTSEATVYRPQIPVEFVVDGVTYRNDHYDLLTWYADHESAAAVAAGFVEGQSYPIWYDPADPQRAVLVRGQSLTFWLLMLLPLAFLATGVGGLAYNVWQWAISRERRAAIAQLASSRERLDESGQVQPRLPAVPYDADVTNSPGTTLAYRLPIATLRGWRLFALTGACLAWNTLVAVLLWLACRNHLEGRPDWIMDVTTGVFAIPGLWLAYKLAEQLLYSSGIGMTRVEISQHPLEPGGRYEVYLSQGGRLAVKKLELMLICEEQATYRQGTDTVTDKRLVNIQPIWQKSDFRIQPPDMFETRCNFAVPSTAMHSFRSEHNAVTWKLVIRGDVERWAAYERDFPVVVVPNAQSDPPEVHGTTLAAAP